MENMLNRLALAQTNPAPQATNVQPHIVSITPLFAAPAATKFEEHMDSAIASQCLQAVASHTQVLSSAPTQATTVSTSAPQMVAPPNIAPASSNLQSPL